MDDEARSMLQERSLEFLRCGKGGYAFPPLFSRGYSPWSHKALPRIDNKAKSLAEVTDVPSLCVTCCRVCVRLTTSSTPG